MTKRKYKIEVEFNTDPAFSHWTVTLLQERVKVWELRGQPLKPLLAYLADIIIADHSRQGEVQK